MGHLGDALELVDADPGVDEWELVDELLAVALRQAAGDDDGAAAAARFVRGHLRDDGAGLLAGRGDKGAGVDQDDVGVVGIVREGQALGHEHARHDLRVDEVLGAAEADQTDGGWWGIGWWLVVDGWWGIGWWLMVDGWWIQVLSRALARALAE